MYPPEVKAAAVDLIHNGFSYRKAARICGIPHQYIQRWHHALDDEDKEPYSLVEDMTRSKKDDSMDIDNLPDDPEELKRIIRDMQFEIDVTQAVIEIVKKDPGVDPKTLPNKQKSMLVDALKKKNPLYSINYLTSFLNLAPASFYYHKKRIGIDPDADLKRRVIKACRDCPAFGYRRIKHLLDAESKDDKGISEKRIRRIMAQAGLQPSRRRKNSRYNSYDARKDNGEALPNVPLRKDGTHSFIADAPNKLWVSDVTEFTLPNNEKVYLSPVLDCYDSSLTGWAISTSEKAEDLTNPSLLRAVAKLKEGERCWAHTDRGGQYFSRGWIAIAEQFGLQRSMSRKGYSPDNARMEGFFGRLKIEFFDTKDWSDTSVEEFIKELDDWLVFYNERREKQSLGWLTPLQYRERYYQVA